MFIRVCVCGVCEGWRSCWVCFPIAHILFLRQGLTELILPIQGALGSPISRVLGMCYHVQLSWRVWRLNLGTSLMDSPTQCPVPRGWLPTEVLCRPFSRILGNLLIAQSARHSLALIRCDTQVPATLHFWNSYLWMGSRPGSRCPEPLCHLSLPCDNCSATASGRHWLVRGRPSVQTQTGVFAEGAPRHMWATCHLCCQLVLFGQNTATSWHL